MLIGQFAEKSGLSLRSIRRYDDIGLLKAAGRTEGGFRVYTAADLARVRVIRGMRALGFAHDEIKDFLAVREASAGSLLNATAMERFELADLLEDVVQRERGLRKQLELADEFIGMLRRQ